MESIYAAVLSKPSTSVNFLSRHCDCAGYFRPSADGDLE